MYSPHDPGAPEPLDRLMHWTRTDRSWWKRWLIGIVTSVLAIAIIAACGWCLVVFTLYRPHAAGVYAIPDSHEPMVFSIAMVSADEGWAVGAENHYRTQGMLAHYQNGQWKPASLPATTPGLFSVFMLSASEGWAVGYEGAILHYQSGRWSRVSSPVTAALYSVFMLSPDEGWAGGDAGLLHYQSGVWQVAQSQGSSQVRSIFMLSATEGWAVGLGGVILHDTDGQWQVVQPLQSGYANLTSVAFASPDEGWAVGYGGIILRYQAGAWGVARAAANGVNLSAVALVSPTEGWAVGSTYINGGGQTGAIFHYSQGQWTQIASPTHSTWNTLAMVSADNGWTGGSQGTLLQYEDGKWC